jgi:type IV secretory pathway VirB2 component (pilin)
MFINKSILNASIKTASYNKIICIIVLILGLFSSGNIYIYLYSGVASVTARHRHTLGAYKPQI